ncbi:MAG: hypothetical protein SGPRY_002621 [Prymnesium sp.]
MSLRSFVQVLRSHDDCANAAATQALQATLQTWTARERYLWMQPVKGIWRKHIAQGPCEEELKWWVPDGDWVGLPRWAHCCDKGAAIVRCPGKVIDTPGVCDRNRAMALARRCEDDATPLCEPYMRSNARKCLVYSFGIATQWSFEDWAAQSLQCEVHAFDPTTRYRKRHESHRVPGVSFHYEGLGSLHGTAKHYRSIGYGALGGRVQPLDSLVLELGHQNRSIHLLKIDCEVPPTNFYPVSVQQPLHTHVEMCAHRGESASLSATLTTEQSGRSRVPLIRTRSCGRCEWESFVDVARRSPQTLRRVHTLILELHFSRSLQMNSTAQLQLMAAFWSEYIINLGFRFWFIHRNPGVQPTFAKANSALAWGHADLHPELMSMGLPEGI